MRCFGVMKTCPRWSEQSWWKHFLYLQCYMYLCVPMSARVGCGDGLSSRTGNRVHCTGRFQGAARTLLLPFPGPRFQAGTPSDAALVYEQPSARRTSNGLARLEASCREAKCTELACCSLTGPPWKGSIVGLHSLSSKGRARDASPCYRTSTQGLYSGDQISKSYFLRFKWPFEAGN